MINIVTKGEPPKSVSERVRVKFRAAHGWPGSAHGRPEKFLLTKCHPWPAHPWPAHTRPALTRPAHGPWVNSDPYVQLHLTTPSTVGVLWHSNTYRYFRYWWSTFSVRTYSWSTSRSSSGNTWIIISVSFTFLIFDSQPLLCGSLRLHLFPSSLYYSPPLVLV